jgi:enoyl-[acyl-carrier protein] reductase III
MNPSVSVDPFSVRDRRVLVVGGTRGIGRAIASRLAAAGANVIVNYVRDDRAAEEFTSAAVAAGHRVHSVRADVTSDKGKGELLKAVTSRFADLSVLVFAAATGIHRPYAKFSGRHFDFTFDLNVKAFLALVQAFGPKMPAGASIIALSSEGAVHAIPQYGLVGASKAALESLCRHLAVELAPQGVRVNVLSPGTVRTDAWDVLPDADRRLAEAAAHCPRGRLTSPEEVAWAAQFLASDAASGLAGHTLVVDGGARVKGVG